MSYRLTDATDLPQSSNALLTIVHPQTAVDIVSRILNPYTSASDPVENLDPNQRKDDILENLALGNLVLIDASGSSPGIFRHRRSEADALVNNIPPRLKRALDDHWENGSSGAGGVPVKSDSLAPAIEPEYQPPPVSTRTSEVLGLRSLELIYRWPDGTGVAGAPYSVDGLNSLESGILDNNGYALVTGLNDPVVNVRFGNPATAGELDILRRQLQAELDGILVREQQEAARLDESTENLPLTFKAGVHFVNGFMGLWDSAVGLISNNLALANMSHLGYYGRALQSAWTATLDSSDEAWLDAFKQEFDESNKRALIDVLGFDPDSITYEQLAEAYETTNLILNDRESREMLGRFVVDFAHAQDSTELSYFAGGLVFEVVLAIMLASTLGASAASAAPRYLRKLAPLAASLRNLAARLKVAYQTRYHYNVDTETVCESTCRPRPEGVELKPRDLGSRRLVVHSLAEAREALARSRRRLIARGGFTPKYTQDELKLLANQDLSDDRFIVRILEEHHVDGYKQPIGSMNGTLGRPAPTGEVRFWATTLDQIEPSDTDPKLIAEQLGITYNPKATYKLAIIDKDVATEKAGAKTFIPTFDNLKKHVRDNVDGYAEKDEMLDEVMTPEYQAKYEKIIEGMGDAEWDSADRRILYLRKLGLDGDQIKAFEIRFGVQDETGANQYFLGNGLTKHTRLSGDESPVYGAVETFTIEKNPQTFRIMTNGGEGGPDAYVELVDLIPIEFGD